MTPLARWLWLGLALGACEKPLEGAMALEVSYSLAAKSDTGCVRLVVKPEDGDPEIVDVALEGRQAGTRRVGVRPGVGWGTTLEVLGTLHRGGCDEMPVVQARHVFSTPPGGSNKPQTEIISLIEDVTGAGGGAGGGDGGGSATGGGSAMGGGGGETVDAGPPDAGVPDAGPPGVCDGGFVEAMPRVMPMSDWEDVGFFDGGAWLVGNDGARLFSNGQWVRPANGCTGSLRGLWVRPDGVAFVAGGDLYRTTPDGGCVELSDLTGLNNVTALSGGVVNGETVVVGVTDQGHVFAWRESDLLLKSLKPASRYEDLDGTFFPILVAVGDTSGKSAATVIDLRDGGLTAIDMPFAVAPMNNSQLGGISMVSGSFGYAAGKKGIYALDGGSWVLTTSAPALTETWGLRAFSSSDVFAVGKPAEVWHFNGAAWQAASQRFGGPMDQLSRIRGSSVCGLVAPGHQNHLIQSQ